MAGFQAFWLRKIPLTLISGNGIDGAGSLHGFEIGFIGSKLLVLFSRIFELFKHGVPQ